MKVLYISCLLLIASCSSHQKWQVAPKDITIMTYNVENLFDTLHDENKNDYTYLPKAVKAANPQYTAECESIKKPSWRNSCFNTDWNESALQTKMERLADVIFQVKSGQGPDVLLLQEVENIRVLDSFRKQYLIKAGYKPVLLEGPDRRGIDTALLTKLPIATKPILHTLSFKSIGALKGRKKRPTRGILEVTLKLPNQDLLTLFVVHFPSQGGPTELRRQALQQLSQLTQQLPQDRMIIVGGDFNIIKTEDIKNRLLKTYIEPQFLISHQVGLFNEKGTENYHGHWSFLDMLFFSKNMDLKSGDASWFFKANSLRIPKASIYQVSRFYTPNRFNAKSSGGVSDHFPVAVDISLRPKKQSH